MKINDSLIAYVKSLVQAGYAKTQIKDQLLAVGWSESQTDEAYSKALIEIGVPVPSEAMQQTFGKKSSTMEIVLNLFSFIFLGVVATALGTLFYQIINKYFPDPLVTNYYSNRVSTNAIHYAIAALIVGFPTYWISVRMWFRSFQRDEGKIETKLSKWLTYLVLLIALITIVGDLISTLYTFLQGEISARFILKSLTILVIAGSVFGFYFLERRKIQYRQPISQNIFKLFGLFISGVILFGVVIGFIAGGSPATERKRGFDNQRERDLREISGCIERYAKQFKRLPNTLEELKNSSVYSYCSNKKDPETKKQYEYSVITSSKNVGTNREGEFELCAEFALKSEDEIVNRSYTAIDSKWTEHKAGRDCDRVTLVIESRINK